tara:strand:- start:622 stop:744 length:123 start_codon:yes stop_codon:yes gene_type:complete
LQVVQEQVDQLELVAEQVVLEKEKILVIPTQLHLLMHQRV